MKTILSILISFSLQLIVLAQTDSLVFKNSNVVDGEIKSMDRGVLQIETDYSDSDFQIEWDQIRKIHTYTNFLITLTDSRKYFGNIVSTDKSKVHIVTLTGQVILCDINDIVELKPYKKSFFNRLHASIDIGFSITKANNLKQLDSRSSIGYRARRWHLKASYNAFRSRQNDIEPVQRADAKIDYKFLLPRVWYSVATVAFSTDTEQKLDQRINAQLGLGRFIFRTNAAYWGARLGVNRNVEKYTSETPDRYSWEGYLGTDVNIYDMGDFSISTNIMAYPGITERGRFRSDLTLDTQYDLPYDFYIKIGLTMNYDNQPAQDASEFGYIFKTGFGWEWN
jgi:hypothetical protein